MRALNISAADEVRRLDADIRPQRRDAKARRNAKTGRAWIITTVLAEAMNENAGVITSSPGLTPTASMRREYCASDSPAATPTISARTTPRGIPNVAPACLRTWDRSVIEGALAGNAEAAKLFGAEAIAEGATVHGALTPWIDGLRFWPLEKDPLRSDVRAWLTARTPIPADKAEMAAQRGFEGLSAQHSAVSLQLEHGVG